MDLGVGQRHLSAVPRIKRGGAEPAVRRGARRLGRAILSVNAFHQPVMPIEVIQLLAPQRGGVFLDGTVGGGGHAEAILGASEGVRLLAMDRDEEALVRAGVRLRPFGDRVTYCRGDFAEAAELYGLGEGALAGVLLDLGVSSHQIDTRRRGFSFRPGVPLDMRMSGEGATASDLLANLSAEELAEIFRAYGEDRGARRLASEVVKYRKRAPLLMSDDLLRVMENVRGRPMRASDAAPIFQALRIAVNQELVSLERALPALRDLLAPGGRMVVISYHSLEDRQVKRAFREWSRDCVCPPELPICACRGRALGHDLTRRLAQPSDLEVARNPRARSARLRAWERGE